MDITGQYQYCQQHLRCTLTYVTGTLIGYTVQKIPKAWISLPHTAEVRPFSEIVFSYLNLIALEACSRHRQERKRAMLQDCRPMILQNPLVLWTRRNQLQSRCATDQQLSTTRCDMWTTFTWTTLTEHWQIVHAISVMITEKVVHVQALRRKAPNAGLDRYLSSLQLRWSSWSRSLRLNLS